MGWDMLLWIGLALALALALALGLELVQTGLPDLCGVSAGVRRCHGGHEPCLTRRRPWWMWI